MRSLQSLFLLILATLPVQADFLSSKLSKASYDLEEGDIVFQATGGLQCEAIRAATGSPYSHCGVVFSSNGRLYVLEAISPVTTTPLETFQRRSLRGTFHARRLKNATTAITEKSIAKGTRWAKANLGKPYDGRFLWGDEQLYCSELVWKFFHAAADIELVKPRPFGSYNLEPRIVQALIIERFGSLEKFPAKEQVVTPHDLAISPLLVEVPRRAGKKK